MATSLLDQRVRRCTADYKVLLILTLFSYQCCIAPHYARLDGDTPITITRLGSTTTYTRLPFFCMQQLLLSCMVNQLMPCKSLTEEFIRGFAVFDKDQTGHIGVGELRYVLTNLGEKLTDQEVDELLAGVRVGGDGTIDYRAFVREVSYCILAMAR